MFHIDQKHILNRVLLCLPLIAAVALLLLWSNQSAKTFNQLWNYFAWGNQVLSACTLTGATVWLVSQKKPGWVPMIPGVFMTFIVCTYILWISPAHGGPVGFGMELHHAYLLAAFFAMLTGVWAYNRGVAMTGKFDDQK